MRNTVKLFANLAPKRSHGYPVISTDLSQHKYSGPFAEVIRIPLPLAYRECDWKLDQLSDGQDRLWIDQNPEEQSYSFLVSRVEVCHMSDFVRGSELDIFSSHLTEPIVQPTKRTSHRVGIGRTSRRTSSELAQLCAQSRNGHLN
ncbi:hypothetical protein BofuT4_P011790.1 [Botrytis cinerea T4]|uniref:Uncharacterized protein n=1 Tax=Botryotinia fuckeliana (strain T4) TaxID=999810 RepID=G2XS66_BOTF4|nr:hypothetical protein BofuT4_P011790.1 [Botrytis cinerea T4]